MNQALGIVVFMGTGDWEFYTRQRLLVALGKALKEGSWLLCLERPICPWSTHFLHPKKYWGKLFWKRGLRKVEGGVYVATPWAFVSDIAAPYIPFARALNKWLIRTQVQRLIKRLGRRDKLVVWVSHPYQKDCLRLLGEDVSVYECYDEYAEFQSKERRKERVRRDEDEVLKKADVVCATSRLLTEERKVKHSNVHFLPNGVDYEHFAGNGEPEAPPEELKGLPRPWIGFVGKINENIDWKLIMEVAKSKPSWSFIFLGLFDGKPSLRRDSVYTSATSLTNFHLQGWKDYRLLPQFVRAFDVCLIPFNRNSLMDRVYPLKLQEYLAAGKAVVSTPLPEIQGLDSLIHTAQGAEDFCRQMDLALAENSEDLVQKRKKVASENTWDRRAVAIISQIQELKVN